MPTTNQGTHESGDEYGLPIHVIEKSDREQIRISLNEYKGHNYIDIRQFFQTPEGFRPTSKGVTIRKDLYPELLHGVVLLGEALGYDAAELGEPSDQRPS